MNGRPCVRTQPAVVHKGRSQATAQNSLLLEKVRGYLTRVLSGKWEFNWLAGFVYLSQIYGQLNAVIPPIWLSF